MFVERVLSLNDGWSILTTQKPEEWEEAVAALGALDDQSILQISQDSGGSARDINSLYTFLYYGYLYDITNDYEWPDDTLSIDKKIAIYSDIPAVKNGVLASLMGTDEITGGDFASTVYLHTPYYFTSHIIDVAVYFIASADAVAHFMKFGTKPNESINIPTEVFCRAEIAKLRALANHAPIVLAFFSPTPPEEIAVEEIIPLKAVTPTIERTIEFAPEYYQAGVGLLSYFGEVLRQKDPNTKAKVSIEQDGRIVRLRIESPGGDIETIEKELDQYALVISNQAPPETLFEQRMHIMQLESRLEVAKVEIKNAHDLKQLTEGFYSQQVRSLQQQIDSLTQQVATGLRQQDKVFNLMHQQAGSNERVQLAMLTHSGVLFKDLLQEASGNQQLLEAIRSLHQNLLVGITTIEIEDQLSRALATIKESKPGFLGRISSELQNATYKAAVGSSINWITTWIMKHS